MSQDHDRNVAYGRKREPKMDLPVPNYSDLRSRNLSEKRSGSHNITDNLFSEAYYSSEQSDSPSSGNSLVQEGYASLSTSFQREPSIQSHGPNYQVPHPSVYNGRSAASFPSHHPSEKPPKHQLRSHSTTHSPGPDEIKKDIAGHTASPGSKVPPSQQIEDYKRKAALLRIELATLKDQRNELRGDGNRSASPDTKRFLKENTKLQLETQNKLKTINNVLDVMNGIIGDHTDLHEGQSPERKPKQKWSQKFNYVFYDPEMHWCRVCNVFPQTAKDYLNHLHSPDHQTKAAEHVESPWRAATFEGYPSLPAAPTKRTPIRGLQFFVPATAWYCKLCDQFVGDLNCASDHIKSILHSKNYNKFVQQNPHWETDWVSDRQRAFERAGSGGRGGESGDGGVRTGGGSGGGSRLKQQVKYVTRTLTISKDVHTKKPPKTPPLELEDEKRYLKKRKSGRSSSQSSLNDSGSEAEKTRHKNRRLRSTEKGESKELENFDSTTASESILSDDDRKLLESLKSRMRKKDEMQRSTSRDRERIKELQQRIRESESRGESSERRPRSRERRPRDRDTSPASRDRLDRPDRPDRSERSERARGSSRDRPSRDRRPNTQDRTGGSRERRGGSRSRRSGSRDRWGRSRPRDSQAAGSRNQAAPPSVSPSQPPFTTSSSLPMPTAAMPKITNVPPRATLPPRAVVQPAIMPPPPIVVLPQSVPEAAEAAAVPAEFRAALELLFPTDPATCADMLAAMHQPALHQPTLHQPGLLAAPPPLPLPYPLAFPPGMYPFPPPNPTMFPTQHLPALPLPQIATVTQRPRNHRPPRTPADRQHTRHKGKGDERGAPREPRPTRPHDELALLGIDAGDVGAGI